jgi:hypothetical protein
MSPHSMTWKRVSNKITDLSLPILKNFKRHANLGASVKLQFSALFWRCLCEDLFTRYQLPERQSGRKPPENRADEILCSRPFHSPSQRSRNALPRSTTQSARLRKMSFTPLQASNANLSVKRKRVQMHHRAGFPADLCVEEIPIIVKEASDATYANVDLQLKHFVSWDTYHSHAQYWMMISGQ